MVFSMVLSHLPPLLRPPPLVHLDHMDFRKHIQILCEHRLGQRICFIEWNGRF